MLRGKYYEIVRDMHQAEIDKMPISDLVRERGFIASEKKENGEVYRSVLEDNDSCIIASIISVEHDKAFGYTPDTYHNYLEYRENGKLIDRKEYMYSETYL